MSVCMELDGDKMPQHVLEWGKTSWSCGLIIYWGGLKAFHVM